MNSVLDLTGNLGIKKIPAFNPVTYAYRNRMRLGFWWGWLQVQLAFAVNRMFGIAVFTSELRGKLIRRNGAEHDLGVLSRRVVTNNGVGYIVDAFQNLVELENMKYHGVGTGGTAEAAGDSALVTESTTALNPDSTRGTGTTTESASNAYQTVGTVTFDGSAAITEHGIFSQAATGGGVLLDRSLFSAINVVSGDSIQFTYTLTFTAGG
jgi:hypothetical protein